MRHILPLVLTLTACGPLDTVDDTSPPPASSLSIENRQGESLFSVTYTTPDGMTVDAIDGERVGALRTETFDRVIVLDYGAETTITVRVTTLGEEGKYSVDTTTEPGTLALLYDFDFALGKARVRYEWQP